MLIEPSNPQSASTRQSRPQHPLPNQITQGRHHPKYPHLSVVHVVKERACGRLLPDRRKEARLYNTIELGQGQRPICRVNPARRPLPRRVCRLGNCAARSLCRAAFARCLTRMDRLSNCPLPAAPPSARYQSCEPHRKSHSRRRPGRNRDSRRQLPEIRESPMRGPGASLRPTGRPKPSQCDAKIIATALR